MRAIWMKFYFFNGVDNFENNMDGSLTFLVEEDTSESNMVDSLHSLLMMGSVSCAWRVNKLTITVIL